MHKIMAPYQVQDQAPEISGSLHRQLSQHGSLSTSNSGWTMIDDTRPPLSTQSLSILGQIWHSDSAHVLTRIEQHVDPTCTHDAYKRICACFFYGTQPDEGLSRHSQFLSCQVITFSDPGRDLLLGCSGSVAPDRRQDSIPSWLCKQSFVCNSKVQTISFLTKYLDGEHLRHDRSPMPARANFQGPDFLRRAGASSESHQMDGLRVATGRRRQHQYDRS